MIRKLNVKNVEMTLQQLETFGKPKVELEQYHTPPRTAAEILVLIEKVQIPILSIKKRILKI